MCSSPVPLSATSNVSTGHDGHCFSFQTDGFLKDNNNAAQRLLDGMNFMAQSVSELSLGPTKAVTSWLTDQIAPAYWRPNSQILVQWDSCPLCCIPSTACTACAFGPVWSLFWDGAQEVGIDPVVYFPNTCGAVPGEARSSG